MTPNVPDGSKSNKSSKIHQKLMHASISLHLFIIYFFRMILIFELFIQMVGEVVGNLSVLDQEKVKPKVCDQFKIVFLKY